MRATLHRLRAALLGAGLLSLTAASVMAAEISGAPGSPSATSTIGGKQLPPARLGTCPKKNR